MVSGLKLVSQVNIMMTVDVNKHVSELFIFLSVFSMAPGIDLNDVVTCRKDNFGEENRLFECTSTEIKSVMRLTNDIFIHIHDLDMEA